MESIVKELHLPEEDDEPNFVYSELDSGRLRRLKTSFQIPPRSVDMCMLRDVPQTPAAQRFSDFVKAGLAGR